MLPINREVPLEVVDGDEKTIIVRCVPLDSPTEVSDDGRNKYTEVWRSGAFEGLRPQKTVLQRNHGNEPGNIFAIGRSIEESDGAVQTTFSFIDAAPIAPMARELLRAETWEYASVSVLMKPDGIVIRPDGTVERRKVSDFRHVALVDTPAYPQAKVLAMREEGRKAALAYLDVLRSMTKKRPRR